MTDLLTDIVNKIELGLQSKFTGKYYGLTEIFNAQSQTYPVTTTLQRLRISPADTWQLQIYHRALNLTRTPDLEFGKNKNYAQQMRMVIIANINLGEDLGHKILNALPLQVVVSPNSAVVDTTEVLSNDAAIATTEF